MATSTVVKLPEARLDAAAVLGALADPVFVIGVDGQVMHANPPAEQFFAISNVLLKRQTINDLAPFGSPLLALIEQARSEGYAASEYGVELGTPRTGMKVVDIRVSPIPEAPGAVVVRLDEKSMAHKIDRQLTYRGAARSVTGMAAVLAHEVKNPLSGIRGAAQLLEQSVSEADREFTRLICDETDRICALVDRMEVFSDKRPLPRGPVNIHQVLEHVRKVAQAGFGKQLRFIEQYDPSLPPVFGNRDQLVQVFLNLVKNAAEAAPLASGEIILTTAYRHGLRLALRGTHERVHLPLEVSVQDNGPGVSEDLMPHLFEPFVTTKPTGTGLGLALVAKIIGDHGGLIECDRLAGRTAFNVRLPVETARPVQG